MPLNAYRLPHTAGAVEIAEVTDFLAPHAPFDALPPALLRHAARRLEVTYARHGTTILAHGDENDALYLIRAGAVELREDGGALVARLEEGEAFGYPSLLTRSVATRAATALEDSLLYLLPNAAFDHLRSQSEAFDQFFGRAHAERIRAALQQPEAGAFDAERALTTPVGALLTRDPVSAAPDLAIRQAAQQMRAARVSSLLVAREGVLLGILTDRDLRTRVLAEGAAPEVPVATVMTADPVTISASAYAFEALLTMTRHDIHHLPVFDGERLAGVITTTDLMRLQAASPVYLVGEMGKGKDVESLVSVSRRVPGLVVRLMEAGARAPDIARVITAVTDALTRRLLALAEERLGPPPVPYVWLALGSQARREQTAHSDQDSALVFSDEAAPDDDAYFAALARFVSNGLHACGYVYCPGDVMATNPRWRQPLKAWQRQFERWILEPEPKALMHASIFFDLRALHGEAALAEALREQIAEHGAANGIFLASLAQGALAFQPPLGFFRQFVLKPHGDQEKTLDIKHQGLVPVVDLARIYALAGGVRAVSTAKRLDQAAAAGTLAAADARALRDALDFIAQVRLAHQARQIRAGTEPDNYVAPETLSAFERRHLKDAFRIVADAQAALAQRYQTGLIS